MSALPSGKGRTDTRDVPPEMLAIPDGAFLLGSSEDDLDWIVSEYPYHPRYWYEDEAPQTVRRVAAFLIDRCPVTNAQFQVFVESDGYVTVAERAGGSGIFDGEWWYFLDGANWRHPGGPHTSIADREDHPVVHVTIDDARAFARWAGKRLPREEEWEYVAKGGQDFRWPWGNQWDRSKANCAEHWLGHEIDDPSDWRSFLKHEFQAGRLLPKTSSVGAFLSGRSSFGALDMVGNVYELVDGRYSKYDPARTYDDMYELLFQKYIVVRGGSWMNFRYQIRCAERIAFDPTKPHFAMGFRCARDIE